MRRSARVSPYLLPFILLLAVTSAALAQDSAGREAYTVMGQPPRWKPYAGAFAGINNITTTDMATNWGGFGLAGLYHDLMNPLIGVGIAGEAYLGYIAEEYGGGARLNLAFPVAFLQGGVDYSITDNSFAFILSFAVPIRRGGILGHGSLARIDWLPSRGQTINLGVQVPVLQPWAGKTRPKAQDIVVPRASHAQFERAERMDEATTNDPSAGALALMQREALWTINLLNVFYAGLGKSYEDGLATQRDTLDAYIRKAALRDPLHPQGWNPRHEIAIWHAQMAAAFAAAAGTASGADIARTARRALLDSVLIPYDARFGQYKDPNQIMGLGGRGRLAFEAWVAVSDVAPDRRTEVLAVFDGILGILERCREQLYRINGTDSRLNWMPLQFALEADEHDDQAELDRLIARVADRPFADGNTTTLLPGQQFQQELADQIASARNYQVLWVHDFRGVAADQTPDSIGAFQSLNYLRALLRGVERYDSLGSMPSYFIFYDQNYYETGRSRLWMSLLQDPLGHELRLPAPDSVMQRQFRVMQDSLRAAVAGSTRLQGVASVQGRSGVTKLVRVNVSITQPSDLSYRSTRIIGVLPLVGDNLMRDHRKVTFFDLNEEDPAVGRAAYTGVGVAEGYTTPAWDDRVLVVAGPAILTLKEDAERLLLRNGFTADEIPAPLRPRALGPDYAARVATLQAQGHTARGVQVHNDVGFGWKRASVVEMMLITLMPPGSLIFIPDSLWTSLTYASHLVVAALRGCDVYLVAPAFANAPASSAEIMTRSMDIFARLLEVQNHLTPELASDGGGLRIGLYTRTSPVNDAAARQAEVANTFRINPWLQQLFLPGDSTMRRGEAATASSSGAARRPSGAVTATVPKLHAKTQLFATVATLRAVAPFLPARGDSMEPAWPGQAFGDLTPAQRDSAILFLTVGSQNKDTRGLFLDGEISFVVAGPWALQAYTEMFNLFGMTTWIRTQEEFKSYFPDYSERQRRFGYRIRKAL